MFQKFFYIITFSLLLTSSSVAKELILDIPQILLIDKNTGTILFEKNANEEIIPGSFVKLMTAKIIFDAVRDKKISLNKQYYISDYAWKTGGAPSKKTTMFAKYHSFVDVDSLLHGLTITNANDAAIALAEGYAGSEKKFVKLMNLEAKKLGLNDTYYVDSTGFSQEKQKTSLRDTISLLQAIEKEHPDFYKYYHISFFSWNKIKQSNKNPLKNLSEYSNLGILAYNEENSYMLVASVSKKKQTLYLVMTGIKKKKEVALKAQKILNWGFENFKTQDIFWKDEIVSQAKVFAGKNKFVPLKLQENLRVLVPKDEPLSLTAKLIYKGPLLAPIDSNQPVGKIEIYRQKKLLKSQNVFTVESVKKSGFLKEAKAAFSELCLGWIRRYLSFF